MRCNSPQFLLAVFEQCFFLLRNILILQRPLFPVSGWSACRTTGISLALFPERPHCTQRFKRQPPFL